MAKRKRAVAERTEDWGQLQLLLYWPEQMVYELIRPVVVFGDTAGTLATITTADARSWFRHCQYDLDRQAL
jgi:hypothetical protein